MKPSPTAFYLASLTVRQLHRLMDCAEHNGYRTASAILRRGLADPIVRTLSR